MPRNVTPAASFAPDAPGYWTRNEAGQYVTPAADYAAPSPDSVVVVKLAQPQGDEAPRLASLAVPQAAPAPVPAAKDSTLRYTATRAADAAGIVVWSAPEAGDETRERRADVAGFRVAVWRSEPGAWRWGAILPTRGDVLPAFYGAPSLALAQRDAEAWARANAAHGSRLYHAASSPLRPPSLWAIEAGELRRFLANPGAAGFMVEPPPSLVEAAEARRAAMRAALAAETVSGGA